MLTIVVGAGYTGSRILRQIPDAVGLRRSDGFDLDKEATLPASLPQRYRIIYTVPPSEGRRDQRLRRLLGLLEPLPQRFVYLSTTGVYGDCGGVLVDEEQRLQPSTPRARRRAGAEEMLLEWGKARQIPVTILRVPGIYGPGRLGMERLVAGEPVLREADTSPGNRIHVDDLARCCIAALSAPAGVYNVADGDHRSATWFNSEVARQSDLPAPVEISLADAEKTFSPLRLSFLSESRRIGTRKMRNVLGVTPHYRNAADGIRASLKATRSN